MIALIVFGAVLCLALLGDGWAEARRRRTALQRAELAARSAINADAASTLRRIDEMRAHQKLPAIRNQN